MPRIAFSRRSFLHSATIFGGMAGFLGPRRGLAASPNDRLAIACIGMGSHMCGYLLPELPKSDQQIVAICDVDQRQLDSARTIDRLGDARTYRDYRELLDKERDVDAVVVATRIIGTCR